MDTFPIPNPETKLSEIEKRLQSQHEMLVPIVAKLNGAMDERIGVQGNALRRIGSKMSGQLTRRIKGQAGAIGPIAAKMYSALDDRLAAQASANATQSAVLSRLGVPAEIQPISPELQPGSSIFAPPSQQKPQFPSDQSLGGLKYAVLVDCNKKTIAVYDMLQGFSVGGTMPFDSMVRNGAFVPIRYSVERDSLDDNWMGRTLIENRQYQQSWIDIACHARETNGEGWPFNGDFPHDMQTSVEMGLPVGDWPFDANGNYIGL